MGCPSCNPRAAVTTGAILGGIPHPAIQQCSDVTVLVTAPMALEPALWHLCGALRSPTLQTSRPAASRLSPVACSLSLVRCCVQRRLGVGVGVGWSGERCVWGGGCSTSLLSSVHPNAGVTQLGMASAHVHAAGELCVRSGGRQLGTPSPLSCQQKGTSGFLLAIDERLSRTLPVRALARP